MKKTERDLRAQIENDIRKQGRTAIGLLMGPLPLLRSLRLIQRWAEASAEILGAFGAVDDDLIPGNGPLQGRGRAVMGGVRGQELEPFLEGMQQVLGPLASASRSQQVQHLSAALARAKDADEPELADRIRTMLDRAMDVLPEQALNTDAPDRIQLASGEAATI